MVEAAMRVEAVGGVAGEAVLALHMGLREGEDGIGVAGDAAGGVRFAEEGSTDGVVAGDAGDIAGAVFGSAPIGDEYGMSAAVAGEAIAGDFADIGVGGAFGRGLGFGWLGEQGTSQQDKQESVPHG
jgi:hypothetical protein